jgi:hypothetical protein
MATASVAPGATSEPTNAAPPIHSPLTCFDTFLKLLDTWLDLSANGYIERQTSSFRRTHQLVQDAQRVYDAGPRPHLR